MKRKERTMPKVGMKFEKKMRNGAKHVLAVVEVSGRVQYQVGRRNFKSPSAAAKSVNGGQEVNGWIFWKMDQ